MDGVSSHAAPGLPGPDLGGPDLAGLAARAPSTPQAQEAAAVAFESVFASLLLKQMRQSSEPGEGLFGADPGEVYGGLFDHFMGQHLARQKCLGIADLVRRQWFARGAATAHREASP